MSKITNREAGHKVARKETFTTGNETMFANWVEVGGAADPQTEGLYVVYSYRISWPIYVWSEVAQKWFANKDKFSLTTSRHMSYAHPPVAREDLTWLHLDQMMALAAWGYAGLVQQKLEGETR